MSRSIGLPSRERVSAPSSWRSASESAGREACLISDALARYLILLDEGMTKKRFLEFLDECNSTGVDMNVLRQRLRLFESAASFVGNEGIANCHRKFEKGIQ